MNFRNWTTRRATNPVWRAGPDEFEGKWADTVTVPPPKMVAPERDTTSWAMSSFDLRRGAEVTDFPDTVPGEVLDEWFPPRDDPPTRSGK